MCVLSKCLHMLVVDEECFIRIDGHLLHLTYWLFWSSSKCFHTSERLGNSAFPILKESSTHVILVSSKIKIDMDMSFYRITGSMLQLGAVHAVLDHLVIHNKKGGFGVSVSKPSISVNKPSLNEDT